VSELTLILGNKNYSSWSLRPWLALKHVGVPFREVIVALDQPTTAAQIARYSPSGRVPVLQHGELSIWDSLAICEYLNESFPAAQLWPADPKARAWARSISAEMHSSFTALRQNMPMKIRESLPGKGMAVGVQEDIDRITAIWRETRSHCGQRGAFLFGELSIADAMYAPVATRFQTYGVKLDSESRDYADALLSLPAMKEWYAAAAAEPLDMPRYR
jgi:glutathione S-transferase